MISYTEDKLPSGLDVYYVTICGFKYGDPLYSMWQVQRAIMRIGEPHPNDFENDEEAREAIELQRSVGLRS